MFYFNCCLNKIFVITFANVPVFDSGPVLLCNVSIGVPRPVVPQDYRRHVFNVLHSISHPGQKATVKLISQKFVWHGLKKQVGQWSKECLSCQRSKVHTHIKAPLQNFTVPEKRSSHIHVYLVGPLQPSAGYTHLLTIVDRTMPFIYITLHYIFYILYSVCMSLWWWVIYIYIM